MAVCVCYCCIPFGISDVSVFSLLLVCACDLLFVLGVFCFLRVMCCSSVRVGLAHRVQQSDGRILTSAASSVLVI